MAANLPTVQSPDLSFMLLQTRWKSVLDPVLRNPILDGNLVPNVTLTVGSTFINHGLSRMQQGWLITDQNGVASIYRSASFNDKTLVLASNAAVTIDVWCF